ncbi:MAG TPA: amidohydrolase family protein [Lacunisphaera sp.]|nr:amidohydrolase family protein [Lacunisphaera sp.]
MAIIDAHVHLYPPEVNRDPANWAMAHGEAHWARLCTRQRRGGFHVQGFPSVDDLLREMDAAGVDRAVLLGWYWEHHATCVAQNRFYAECVRAHPARFAAFATVHPAAGEGALDEVRWAHANGFSGLGELSPHSQYVPLVDPFWRKMLSLAGDLGLPVNLHVTDPQSKVYPGRVETPLEDFVTLAREFPQTNFILAHWGGGLAWNPVAARLSNVYFDTAASPLLYGADVWTKAPAGRVLFGSDYPLVLYPGQNAVPELGGILAEARNGGFRPAELGGNAAQLLRL